MPARKKTQNKDRIPADTVKKDTGLPSKASPPARKKEPVKTPDAQVRIVGIGSSAGGLEALKDFFQQMPDDNGMAFVLVPHLDPHHKSMMVELLQKYTSMPVREAKDGTGVAVNTVHIIPPDKMLSIGDGTLHVLDTQEERAKRHPIDNFFRSLAEDQGDNAIGIILSGTGTEGILGTKAIKGAGGLVIVQDPDSAKFDGMPQSSIGTGLVDYILPPHEIPEKLIQYVRKISTKDATREDLTSDENLRKIFNLIRRQTGHDFSLYKKQTISRRIERRMAVHQFDTLDSYLRYLRDTPEEINILFREILIRVTNFFRDTEAFISLEEKVLPYLIAHLSSAQTLRVWIAACSTGEEAYSIAMVLDEYVSRHGLHIKIQIFATDIDDNAIGIARAGIYPRSIDVDVSEERLHRYFSKVDNGYQVNDTLRENIVFATQNSIKDPPLSRMDLICCRNLLIYFKSVLQKKMLSLFHYALNPGGILFLGASETTGSNPDLFDVFDSKWKFFKPLAGTLYANDELFQDQRMFGGREKHAVEDKVLPSQFSLDKLTRKMLLEIFAPACVIIREDGTILYFYGKTGKYLEPAQGQANLNIFNMARRGLKTGLQEAVKAVKSGQKEFLRRGLQVRTNGNLLICNLKVIQITIPEHVRGLLMVAFENIEEKHQPQQEEKTAFHLPKDKDRVEELEYEIKSVKEHLQTTIEELETSNEELQSTNEELQSTNEELETSREELQSVNEELMTVNAEAQEKIGQLTRSTYDMKNLLASTEIATVFLDLKLRIKNFTPAAVRIFKLITSDIGRPISDMVNILQYDKLDDDMREVLRNLIPRELQVLDEEGFWYLMKIQPYRTENNMAEGVVLTLVDITKQKHAEAALAESEERQSSILGQTGEGFILVDYTSGAITDSNPEFQKMIGRHAWQLERVKIWELTPHSQMESMKKIFRSEKGKPFATQRTMEFLDSNGTIIPVHLQGKVIMIGSRKYIQCFMRRAEK